MIKLIIKNPDGTREVQDITENMDFKPLPGQQFYFDNLDSKKHTFNLTDGEESIELIFDSNGEKYVFNFEGMANLIKESNSIASGKNKTVLGIINDQEGMDELNQTVLNPDFQSDNIISDLKDLLAQSDKGADYQNGIIIDDFGSLAEALSAAAAGGATSDGSTTQFNFTDPSGNSYGVDGRGVGQDFIDPNDPTVDVDGTNNDDPTDTEPYNAVITLGDLTTVEGTTDATITATVSNPPLTDLIITLDNGSTITIIAGETTGTSTPFSVQADDVFKDAGTETVTITGTTGGGYDNLEADDSATIIVNDTPDETNATLTSAITGDEDGAVVTYKITIDTAPTTDETFTFKVDGVEKTIIVEAGKTTGTTTVEFEDSDSIKDVDTIPKATDLAISDADGASNYEDLQLVNNSKDETVEDSIDTTTVTVGDVTVDEDATSAKVDVKLEGHDFKTGETVTVKLSDGTEVTFTENGTKEATITVTADSDSIIETDSTTSITATVSSDAGTIEKPVVNAGELTVEDSIDTTTVTVGDVTVDEDATSAKVDVKLEGHDFKTGETVTVKLSDGTEVTFTENGTKEATITVTADSDSIIETDSTTSITATVSSDAGTIEKPVVNAGELTVEDSIDTTTVTVGDVTVDEDATSAKVDVKLEGHDFKTGETVTVKLSDGTEVTFTENGTKEATITVTADSDSIIETDSTTSITATVSSDAGTIEKPVVNAGELTVEDSIDTTTVTVGDVTVDEDATSAKVDVKLEGHDFKTGETVTVKLSDGTEVTFTENGTKEATITVTADSDSIIETDSTTSITATVSSDAGTIEKPVVNAGELTVEDSIDTTTVTVGDVTVDEDATSAKVDVKLEGHDFKTGETVTVKLSDGTEVTFTENGTKEATITVTADSDSIIETDSTTSITATVSSDAGTIEKPVVNAGELTVEDSIDTTTVTVGDVTVDEDATSAKVDVKLEGHDFKTGETVTVKLSDGTEVTFTENGTKEATITVTADSDSIIETDSTTSITATVSSDAGTIEKPVVNAGELTVEDSIDTTTVTVGDVTVDEDATSAKVDVKLEGHDFKTGETVTVKLSDGTEVTFTENGTKEATITVTADSDSIIETDSTTSITATVSSDAGTIEKPVVNAGELTVEDSIDTTTVTVGDVTVDEDATSAKVDVKLEGHDFKTGETVTVKLSDGTEVTFTENGTKEATITVTADSDSIIETDSTTSITATVSSDAGTIEKPVVNAGELTVEDSKDETKIKLSATESVNEDYDPEGDSFTPGNNITYTASLPDGVTAKNDITVTLSVGKNGEPESPTNPALTITIVAGQSSGTVVADEVNRDNDGSLSEDIYIEEDSLSAKITEVSEENAGQVGSLENLTFDDSEVVTKIVDDEDVTTVDILGTITKTSTIDISNANEELSGVDIYAINKSGQKTELSIDTNPNHSGFGVDGTTSGASQELGYDNATNTSEKIVAEFDNEVQSIDVAFSWRNPNEEATIEFFDENGVFVGSALVSGGSTNGSENATITYYDENGVETKIESVVGGSDKIDPTYTFDLGDGKSFSKVEFSAPGNGDDYLINKIDYEEAVDVGSLTTIDPNTDVTLEIQTSNPPQVGTTAVATVMVYGVAYSVTLDENGKGTLVVTLQEGKEFTAEVTKIEGGNFEAVDVSNASLSLNSTPIADEVLTTSNLNTDDAVLANFASNSNTPEESDIAFFKKLDIGGSQDTDGALDGSAAENDSSDPADLGGKDNETSEENLVFDITSLPNYGTLYIEIDGQIIEVDASNLDTVNTELSTADSVYWAATHDDVATYVDELNDTSAIKSAGGVYGSKSDIEDSWENSDVIVTIGRDQNNSNSELTYNPTDGIGVTGKTGGPSNQLGYDANTGKSEAIIMDFTNGSGKSTPVTDAEVAITHLVKNEGEVGVFEAYLDGELVGSYTFSSVPKDQSGADYILQADSHSGNSAGNYSGTLEINDLVFDQLVFKAQEYVDQNGKVTDSSDYFIGGIEYKEVPNAQFEYKVIDEAGNSSDEVKVEIDHSTDTEIPDANNNTKPTTTDDVISTNEDTPYQLTMNDFGTYSDETEATTISIETLPANGVLELDGQEVSAGTEISVVDITAGKLTFTPSDDTDDDSSFEFKVSDGELWSDTQTTTVNVIAVADAPRTSISIGSPTSTSNDTTKIIYKEAKINETLGDEVGDSNINGTNGYNYTEFAIENIDFGPSFANKIVELQMDVTINGSWNNDGDGGYHDDNWTVFVNDVQQALFKYTGSQTSSKSSEGYDGGVKEYNFGNVGNSNSNINDFNHKPVIQIQLDENGKAEIKFSASTTETAENVKINGIIAAEHIELVDNPDYNIYPVDIEAALADTDGSESLSVKITNIPEGAILQDANGVSITIIDGVAEIDVDGANSIDQSLNLIVPDDVTDIDLNIVARATETNDNENEDNYKEATDSSKVEIDDETSTPSLSFSVDYDGSETLFPTPTIDGEIIRKGGNLEEEAEIKTGNNNDLVQVGGSLGEEAEIKTNKGHDTVEVGGNLGEESQIKTGDENDTVKVGGNLGEESQIKTGDGNDYVEIGGILGEDAEINGESGNDSIYLKHYTKNDYEDNKDNLQYRIKNFENIKFKDGEIIGNANAFNQSSSQTTVYNYTITLSAILSDKDGSESLSNITLDNLPSSITSIEDSSGNVYTVTNGTVSLPANEGTEKEYTFTSSSELSASEINSMKASVTSTEERNDDTNTVETNAKIEVEASSNMIGTDADEKFDSQGNPATVNAGAGDDEIIYNSGNTIDGSAGEDTLKVLGDDNESIDLSTIKSNVNNIENIDISDGQNQTLNIDLDDIIDLTDDDNELKIFGDEGDKVKLEGDWIKDESASNSDFNVYKGGTEATSNITVLIDEDVSIEPDL